MNLAAAAEVFGLKKTTARAIWKRFKENGSMVPFSRGGSRRTKITEELKRFVALLINTEPDMTLRQIYQGVLERHNIQISKSTASRALKAIGYTMKLLRLVPEARNNEEQIVSRFAYASMFLRDRPVV